MFSIESPPCALDDLAGVEGGHPDVAGRLGRDHVARLVPESKQTAVRLGRLKK